MEKLLIIGRACYADEFDCEFFGLYTKEEWEQLNKDVSDGFKARNKGEIELYFGTNECLNASSYKDWKRNLKETVISDIEYDFLLNNFGKTWGTGSNFLTSIVEHLDPELYG